MGHDCHHRETCHKSTLDLLGYVVASPDRDIASHLQMDIDHDEVGHLAGMQIMHAQHPGVSSIIARIPARVSASTARSIKSPSALQAKFQPILATIKPTTNAATGSSSG